MLADYFWFRFFRRHRREMRRSLPVVLVLLVIAGIVYAALMFTAVVERIH